jgi:hypothetical protein
MLGSLDECTAAALRRQRYATYGGASDATEVVFMTSDPWDCDGERCIFLGVLDAPTWSDAASSPSSETLRHFGCRKVEGGLCIKSRRSTATFRLKIPFDDERLLSRVEDVCHVRGVAHASGHDDDDDDDDDAYVAKIDIVEDDMRAVVRVDHRGRGQMKAWFEVDVTLEEEDYVDDEDEDESDEDESDEDESDEDESDVIDGNSEGEESERNSRPQKKRLKACASKAAS